MPRVEEVIRTIVELGGAYPDVVQMLQQAASSGALEGCRLEVDAVPQAGRAYSRGESGDDEAPAPAVRSPLPSLFSGGTAPRERRPADAAGGAESDSEAQDDVEKPWGLWPW